MNLSVREPSMGAIDPSRVSKWLHMCELNHGHTCASPEVVNRPGVLRVVDVVNLCIIIAPTPCRYMALSYTWGRVTTVRLLKSNWRALSTAGGLALVWCQLPRTVQDAINLVRSLGERYLWLDTLGLVQDDQDDMEQGIHAMDAIYEGSVLTIIGATGRDANAGLPGVRHHPRQLFQGVEEVTPGVSMVFDHGFADLLRNSTYETRGWT